MPSTILNVTDLNTTELPATAPQNPPFNTSNADIKALDPNILEAKSFAITRRGFDPSEVRSQLQLAATEIRRLQRLCSELTGRLDELANTNPPEVDVRQASELLGSEISSVLEAAHDAAQERLRRAESDAAKIKNDAQIAATAALTDAQTEAERLTDTAESQAQEIIEAAQTQAEEIIERGRVQGKEMVQEAQLVRERMLRDLARKRQTGRTQVEQLRAGRDRLLDALTTVQTSLDAAIEDLVTSVPEARSAANRAGLRISSEPAPTVDELEAEIEAARLVGHPFVAPAAVSETSLPGPISDTFTTGEMEALDHLDSLTPPTTDAEPPSEPTGVAESQSVRVPEAVSSSESVRVPGELSASESDRVLGGVSESESVRVPGELSASESDRVLGGASESDPGGVDASESGRVSGGVVEMEAAREPVVMDASESVRVPEALAERESGRVSGRVSESDSDRVPEGVSERESGRVSGRVSESDSDRVPEGVSESESGRLPDGVAESQSDRVLGGVVEKEAEQEPEGRIDGSVDASIDDAETAAKNLVLSAENVFAKLRSAGKEQPSSESQTNVGLSDTKTAVAPDAKTAVAPDAKTAVAPDTTTDSALLLRKQAVAGAARAMKKVLVEEQGELLDAIRISGGAAMTKRTRQPRHRSYEQAALTVLKEQATALGASSDLDLAPALDNIVQIALEPMNRRLLTISNDALGEEELSDAVRALYREVRSRHLNDAALAASVTVDGLVQIAKARRAATNGLDAEPKVRWVVDPNGACGAECADNALAGDVHAGNEFPTGDRYPPAHPRCTCRLKVT